MKIYFSKTKDGITFHLGKEQYNSISISNPEIICDILNKASKELTDYEIGYLAELISYIRE